LIIRVRSRIRGNSYRDTERSGRGTGYRVRGIQGERDTEEEEAYGGVRYMERSAVDGYRVYKKRGI
jgi:hypothetical protein